MLKTNGFININLENDFQFNIDSFNQFKNLSVYSIGEIIGINPFLMGPHLGTATLVKGMYAYTGLENLIKKYTQNNISIKTVRLKENGTPKESMSFEQIDFQKVTEEKWEHSFIKSKFEHTTFLFIVFELQDGVLYYRGIKKWKMSSETLETDVKSFWTHLQDRILNGVTLTPIQQKNKTVIQNNLPSMNDNKAMHTRPKADDANDKTALPDGQLITKHCYWLNSNFIGETVSDLPPLDVRSSVENSVPQLLPFELELIQSNIQSPIYTIEEFYNLVKYHLPQFNLFQINDIFLNEMGLKIHPPYVFNKKYKKVKDIFNEIINSQNYFVLSDKTIFQTDFFKRHLKNSEKSLSIIKVDHSSYITKNVMESAGLKNQDLESYQSAVLNAIENQEYFTYKSLKKDGFSHEIDEYGFDSIFYESLIRQISYLKPIKLFDTTFFKKSNRKLKSEQFFKYILDQKKESSLKLSQLRDAIEEIFLETVSYESLEKVLLKFDKTPYYSSDLERLFIDKNQYINYLHI
ncbi:MutH/Sau3AI family endonuclease [Peribacillus butanolivorans]|uniref:MutH/Sau3AI family endonuclease n=1 Tax=Peribacillus butanolivorans TaxID=421767 RepID=UPI00366D56D4